MITALLLSASLVCFIFSHSLGMSAHATKNGKLGLGMLILWALGMMMAYAAGIVL